MRKEIGTCYKGPDGIYMLCQVGYNQCCLINLDGGNRYVDAVTTETFYLSEEEWRGVTDGDTHKFQPISIDEVASKLLKNTVV